MGERSIRSVAKDASSKAFVDAATDMGGKKEQIDPEEEEKRWDALVKTLRGVKGGRKTSEFEAAIMVLNRVNPPKDQKFLTLQTILAPTFDALGHVTDARRHARVEEGRPWVVTQEHLVDMYALAKKMHEYFEDVPGEVGWYVGTLHHVADECFAAAKTSHYHFPLWQLKEFSEALDMAAEIHQLAPIDNFEQRRGRVVEFLEQQLRRHMSRDYYVVTDPTERETKHYTIIDSLSAKYGIHLPSEQEVWERDVSEAIKDVKNAFERAEADPSTGRRVNRMDGLQQAVVRTDTLLAEAEGKYPALALPTGHASIQEVRDAFRTRLEEIKKQDLLIEYEEHLNSMQRWVARGDSDYRRYPPPLSSLLDFLKKHKGKVPVEKASALLTTLKEKEQRKIDDVFEKMKTDLGSADKYGAQIKKHGELSQVISTALTDLSEGPE